MEDRVSKQVFLRAESDIGGLLTLVVVTMTQQPSHTLVARSDLLAWRAGACRFRPD